MNKSSESYKVYTENVTTDADTVSGARPAKAPSEGYPGRALPASQQVVDAKTEPGTTVKCAKKQTGENRYPINTHVEYKKEYGPNN